VEREYRVTWGELLLGRYRGSVSIEYSVDVSLRFRFCCIVSFGLVKHRMGAFKSKSQREDLDINKGKVGESLVMEFRNIVIYSVNNTTVYIGVLLTE
jgi:hypothetical protein